MKKKQNKIRYPRRVLIRYSMKALGRLLLALLADVEINGRERLPKKGPLILVGNHAAVLEAVMMAVYTPGILEFIGNGDIPFDPTYAPIVNAYGLIPIRRGTLDREGLKMGLDVLDQNGLLGVFPEGGIWDPAQMSAQIGAAWLSYRTDVPLLPIGFGGIKGGLENAFRFKRPHLTMTVGDPLPPVKLNDKSLSAKVNLETSARQIMQAVNALIPKEDLSQFQRRFDETFQLEIEVFSKHSTPSVPEALQVKHGALYARFLYNPTMMDVLVKNLELPIKPLREVFHQYNLAPVIKAWQSILFYLNDNPGFFTYRFGVEDGLGVKQALLELCALGAWANDAHYSLTLNPVRRYHNVNTGAKVIERGGCFPKSMDSH